MSFIFRGSPSGQVIQAPNDQDTILWDAATQRWTFGAGGGGGAVSSVFGRTGVVTAQSGDYDSDQVDNVSGVDGASVSDALDDLQDQISNIPPGGINPPAGQIGGTASDPLVRGLTDLNGDELAIDQVADGTYLRRVGNHIVGANPAGGVSSVFGRNGAVTAEEGDYTASLVGNDALYVGGATVDEALDNVADMQNPSVATTGNVALTGVPANIDAGVTLVSGATLIFVWLQTNPNENGVYLYNSGGAWTRATRWTTPAQFRTAQPFEIIGGTLYGGKIAWVKLAPTVVGSTPIIFNVALDIQQPTADGQTLQYRASANQMQPAGIKTAQLANADATIDVTQAFCFQLNVQLTQARTITVANTGAASGMAITFDIRVTLAFPLTVINATGATIATYAAASKWYGSVLFGGQWQPGTYQGAT